MGKLQGRIQDFRRGGGTKGGSANLSFGRIFQTLHQNEESGPGGGAQNFTM